MIHFVENQLDDTSFDDIKVLSINPLCISRQMTIVIELSDEKMGFDEKRAGVRKLVLSYWTLLSAEDIFCGHHPTLHLMIKKVLVRFDLMDPYLGDKHSVLE